MNKRGFTLVELLCVIVILAVVILIGSSSIVAVRRALNKNMFETKLDLIISSAKKYGERNKELFLTDTGVASKVVYKKVRELISTDDLQTDEYEQKSLVTNCVKETKGSDGVTRCAVVTNPVEDTIVNELTIKIYMEHNRVYACIPISKDNNKKILNETSCVKSKCTGDSCTWTNCEYSETNNYCVTD